MKNILKKITVIMIVLFQITSANAKKKKKEIDLESQIIYNSSEVYNKFAGTLDEITVLEKNDLVGAYVLALHKIEEIHEALQINHVIKTIEVNIDQINQEILARRDTTSNSRSSEKSSKSKTPLYNDDGSYGDRSFGFFTLFFRLGAKLFHHETNSHHRSEEENYEKSVDTMTWQTNFKELGEQAKNGEQQLTNLSKNLQKYLNDNAQTLLLMKLIGIKVFQLSIKIIDNHPTSSIVRSDDIDKYLKLLTDIKFYGHQNVILCVKDNYISHTESESLSHSRSSSNSYNEVNKGSGSIGVGLLASISSIFKFGFDSSSSNRRSENYYSEEKNSSKYFAHETQSCKSSLNIREASPDESSYAINFTLIDRVVADWAQLLNNKILFKLSCDRSGDFGCSLFRNH